MWTAHIHKRILRLTRITRISIYTYTTCCSMHLLYWCIWCFLYIYTNCSLVSLTARVVCLADLKCRSQNSSSSSPFICERVHNLANPRHHRAPSPPRYILENWSVHLFVNGSTGGHQAHSVGVLKLARMFWVCTAHRISVFIFSSSFLWVCVDIVAFCVVIPILLLIFVNKHFYMLQKSTLIIAPYHK